MSVSAAIPNAEALPVVGQPPPSPRRYPLVGHLPWLLGAGTGAFTSLMAARQHFPQGLFRIELPNNSPTFVFTASLCAELCDETRFHKNITGPLALLRDVARDALFTAHHNEPAWAPAHKLLVPGFTSSAMDRYFPQMLEVADQLLKTWGKAAEAGTEVDVSTDMTRLTLDTIALCGFDRRFNSFDTPELNPFLQSLGRVLTHTEHRLRRPKIIDKLMFRTQRQYRADQRTMNEVVDDVIAARRRLPKEQWPRDFLSLMLDDGADGTTLTDENIRAQVITFLIAGHETTSALLSFTLFQLLNKPHELRKIRDEVDAVLGDSAPTLKTVLGLAGVRRALSEALRLHPPAMAFQVTPFEETVIGGQWRFKPGEGIVIFLPAVHRDPTVWPDPEDFQPDRFLPEAEAARPKNTYKPFGNGKRACIGRQFALVEATLALAMVIRDFDLETDARQLEVLETLTIKPNNFRVRLRRRVRQAATAVERDVACPVDHDEPSPSSSGCPVPHGP